MKKLLVFALFLHVFLRAPAAVYQWTNILGGDWFAVTNWSSHVVPGDGDVANINLAGDYMVRITNGAVTVGTLNLGGPSGTQVLLQGSPSAMGITNLGTVGAHGVMILTNQGLRGSVLIQPGGQLQITNAANKQFYSLKLVNQGTVTWADGSISVGGSSGETTTISNGGLWQITGDNAMNYGGGSAPTWTNTGTLRKSTGSGVSALAGVNFYNAPAGLVDVLSGTLSFGGFNTNFLSGTFNATLPATIKLASGTYADAGGVFTGTGTNLFNGSTLYLRTNVIPGLKLVAGDVYVSSPFQASGTITNLTLEGANLRGTNTLDLGTLTLNTSTIVEQLTILPNGQLVFAGPSGRNLYSATIINQGTVIWASGGINVGGTPPTVISNGGLWQVAGDFATSYGGGLVPSWTNSGILRKTTGTGNGGISGFNFVNQAAGLVDAQSGVLQIAGGANCVLGGTCNASASGRVDLTAGNWTDAGGVTTGAGSNRFTGGTFSFRTNTIPGLRLTGGVVLITGTNTFQAAGTITNLTIDGASLQGTNRIDAGSLTLNGGSINGKLTVLPAGQLQIATAGSKDISTLTLVNQGTIDWSGGGVSSSGTPGTVISNGGVWQLTSDDAYGYGGVGPFPVCTNTGTIRKSAGSGVSTLTGLVMYNQAGGLIQSDTGNLQLSFVGTNQAGTLRLNGGRLSANGSLAVAGGTLSGNGSVAQNALTGGLISPGTGGIGRIGFTSGLNLGSNATFAVAGTGTVPGGSYGQLSVTGAVVLANCTLQINSLPVVPLGTTFVLIDNDGADPVTGTFNGLPDNSILPISGQNFRLRYGGGTGNDVTLVRDLVAQLAAGGSLSNGVWRFSGAGTPASVYTVQATTNFIQWTNLGFATGDIGGNLIFADTNAFRFPYRFYRTAN